MNLSNKIAWQHLLVDLQISLAQIGRELGVSRCALLESKEARFAMIAKLEKQKEEIDKEILKIKSY